MRNVSNFIRKSAASTAIKARRFTCVKIISAFTLCLLLFLSNLVLSGFTAAFADEGRSNNAIVKKAGIFSFAGYHMNDDHGRLSGYGIEFLNLVSEYSHLSFQYVG